MLAWGGREAYRAWSRRGQSTSKLTQVALQEPERAYLLVKAQELREAIDTIVTSPSAAQAKTPEEALQKRIQAAPSYLRSRVEREQGLPEVEDIPGGEDEEKLRVVARYVTQM